MRKLAYCAGGFSAAIFLAHFLLPGHWALPAALAAVVLALTALLLPGAPRRRVMLALLSAAIGFGWYAAASAARLTPAEAVPDELQTLAGRVTEYPAAYEHSCGLTVLLTSPDVPHCKARLYVSDAEAAALRPGDEITAEVKLRPSTQRYGAETDAYTSKGIYLIGNIKEGSLVHTGVWAHSRLYWPKTVAHALKASAQAAFPADVLPFAQALMLGDKTALYAQNLDIPLSTTGIMHTVAVSGLHLAFLLGFLRLFTGNRRTTAIIGLPLMIVFTVIAGGSPSVLRAAFMTALVLFAPLLGRENDPPTSLLTALAVLLAANPFAAGSVSLQLSFASMAGLFCVSGALHRALSDRLLPAGMKLSRPRRRVRTFFIATTASSVGAMVFTVPLTALHFGSISLIAPVTNLLILWLLPAAFIGCYLASLLGLFWAWGGMAAAWVTAWPLRYILAVAKLLSKLPGAVLFTGNRSVVWWLVFTYGVFGAAWVISRRRSVHRGIPAACSVLALCAVLTVNAVQLRHTSTVTALDVSQGQSVVFSSGRSCVMVDCGGRSTVEDPGDIAAHKLLAQGYRGLDLLVLTHPHDDHVNGVLRLMHWLPVRTLAIPAEADTTKAPLSDILALAAQHCTTVVRVDMEQTLTAGGISVRLYPEPCTGREDGSMIVLTSIGTYDTLIPGDVDSAAEAKFLADCTYPDIELLLVGHHGSKKSTCDAWLDAIAPDAAIISVGYNHYGHPTAETLARLQAHDIPIYRTDRMGDVTVHLS